MTRRVFAPLVYQQPMIDHLCEVERGSLWAGLGTGKTVASLTAIDTLHLTGDLTQPVLVPAPLRVAKRTWATEAAKWEHLSGMKVDAIVGDPAERRAALRRVLKGEVAVAPINYDNLVWLIEELDGAWPFGLVIPDEATRLKSFRGGFRVSKTGKEYYQGGGGQRARAIGQFAHRTPRWMNLTGTPSPNGLVDLWGQQWMVDAGQRLGRTFEGFTQRWFQKARNGFGLDPLPFAQEQIQGALRDVSLTIDIKDYYDVGVPFVNDIEVELPPKARALYQSMEKKMWMQLAGGEVEAVHAAARTIKCLQVASGAAFLEDGKAWEHIHDAKIDALASIVEEAGGAPVLVAYHFKPDKERLLRAFPGALDLANDHDLDRAMKGEGRVWLAHPASLGHGVDGLQEHCWIIAFFSHWWSLEEHDQIIERVGPTRQMQAGKNRTVFVHYIIAAATVDELVRQRQTSKRSTQDILLDAMKRKNL